MLLGRVLPLSCLALFAAASAGAVDYQRGYLVNSIMLPTTSSQATAYAIDLNGDGYADNQFAQVLIGFSGAGFDFTGATVAAVASGRIVHLLNLHSTDPLFASDPAAETDWCVGQPAPAPPQFDGTDALLCDNNYAPGIFLAALMNGGFTSADPVTTTTPIQVTLKLMMGPDEMDLPLQGARLTFAADGAGQMLGQINGSISHDDVMNRFVPALAASCNSSIQADPNSTYSTNCKGLFDNGQGCGIDSSAFANNGMIEFCEVAGSPLMQSLLAPDVQIYQNGQYAPNPANTTPDSNSFGFRFTAIAYDRLFANGFEPN